MSISRFWMISRDRHVVDEHVVEALLHLVRIDPLAHSQVPLRIEVDAEHPVPGLGKSHGQIQGSGRLSDPTLLIGKGDHLGMLDRRLRLSVLLDHLTAGGRNQVSRHHPCRLLRCSGSGFKRLFRGWRGAGFLARSLRGRGALPRDRTRGQVLCSLVSRGLRHLRHRFLHALQLLDDRMRLVGRRGHGLGLAAQESHCAGIRMARRFSSHCSKLLGITRSPCQTS